MNAVEHIVESYYRYIKKCYTVTDIKIDKGVGRQIDVLAVCPRTKKFFHVECSVTHIEKWNPHAVAVARMAEFKFCGMKRPKDDWEFKDVMDEDEGYRKAIFNAYKNYGIEDPSAVERIWCSWIVQDEENLPGYKERFRQKHGFAFDFLSFRDTVLPEVERYVGTSNYDDTILRTLSLVRQMDEQHGRISREAVAR